MEQGILQTLETPIDSRRVFDGWHGRTQRMEESRMRCHGRFVTAHQKVIESRTRCHGRFMTESYQERLDSVSLVTSLTTVWARWQEERERSDDILKTIFYTVLKFLVYMSTKSEDWEF